MNYIEINPFIRFANQIYYNSKKNYVYVQDCRIFYILSGVAEIKIANAHYTLQKNSLFYINSNSIYSLQSENISIICLNFDLDQSRNSQTEHFTPQPIITLPKNNTIELSSTTNYLDSYIYIENADKYLDEIQKILEEFSMRRIHYREISSSILKKILCHIDRDLVIPSTHTSTTLNNIVSYIKENYNKNITNKDLSEIANYHEYYLNKIFKDYTGQSIHKYILNIRITNAKKLLCNTNTPITLIAELTGFNSVAHFSSAFKKITGVSPLEYRNTFYI